MVKYTFEEWMKQVDAQLERLCGLSSSDLPDAYYRDEYDSETLPSAMARLVFEAAKEDMGL